MLSTDLTERRRAEKEMRKSEERFRRLFNSNTIGPAPAISPGAVAKLSAYSFPGNILDFRNLLERAIILTRGGAIEPTDLPLP